MAELYRPTQAEVDAQADRMFGLEWKRPYEHEKAWADEAIACRLDAARGAVIAARAAR